MRKKILIIEDDVFLGDVLVQKLIGGGYETAIARDGASGLQKIREWRPDLILLDIIMPTMNGYEVLEQKQKDDSIRGIPVVVISNSGQPVEINRALALGVKDYMVKAEFDPEEVLTKVRLQLGEEGAATGGQGGAAGIGAAPQKPPEIDHELAGKKIMWIEDDQFLSDIIARKLSQAECKLLHATDGEEAFPMIEEEMPDVILLDILLPGMNGFEILNQLKANQKTKMIPVILLSNLGQQEDIDKGKKLGAARFLIKATVTLDEIVGEIKGVLREKGRGV